MDILSNLVASSYSSPFEDSVGSVKVTGTARVSGDKTRINELTGNAYIDGAEVANFSSFDRGDDLRFNLGNIAIDTMPEVAAAIKSAYDSIMADLKGSTVEE